jgi:hypothetical protein
MSHLPVWNGWVVPYFATQLPDGTPEFRVVDEVKRKEAVFDRLCWICGVYVNETGWISFIGGNRSISNRLFFDPGSHEECARYAAQVCPYLSGSKRIERALTEDRKQKIENAGWQVQHNNVVRPTRMGIYTCRNYQTVKMGGQTLILAGKRPSRIDWDIMPASDLWNFEE